MLKSVNFFFQITNELLILQFDFWLITRKMQNIISRQNTLAVHMMWVLKFKITFLQIEFTFWFAYTTITLEGEIWNYQQFFLNSPFIITFFFYHTTVLVSFSFRFYSFLSAAALFQTRMPRRLCASPITASSHRFSGLPQVSFLAFVHWALSSAIVCCPFNMYGQLLSLYIYIFWECSVFEQLNSQPQVWELFIVSMLFSMILFCNHDGLTVPFFILFTSSANVLV